MKISAVQRGLKAADEHALHAIACGLAWANLKITDLERIKTDGIVLDTVAGRAFFRYYPAEQLNRVTFMSGWLHVRFEDVVRAKSAPAVSQQRLNPYSGKYNFPNLDSSGAMHCETELARLAPTAVAAAA